jgi:hypothetical protein
MAAAIRRRGYFFFAPTRSIRLIERAGRPPFSAIAQEPMATSGELLESKAASR